MRHLVTLVLIVVVSGSLFESAVIAQTGEAPTEESEEQRYVPQPAWKSVEVGDYYVKKKNYRAALSRYKEAAKVDPYYPQAYLGMGTVYDRLGLKQKALENYRKYLDLLPSTKEAEEARDVHKAIARLEDALKSSKFPRSTQSSSDLSVSSD